MQRPGPGGANRRARMGAAMASRLDQGGRAWLALLDDPCNAPLAPSCFPGLTSGMLYRTKTVVSPGTAAVDSMLYFVPAGSLTSPALNIQYGSTNTGNTTIATKYGAAITGLPQYGERRCVAACIRVMYTGTELNRGGIIYTHLTTNAPFYDGTEAGTAGPISPVSTYASTSQTSYRLGETRHEVRWVPNFEDGRFTNDTVGAGGTFGQGTTIGVMAIGVPAGSIYYEVTSVWEVVPFFGSGLVSSMMAPPSRNTLNDVIRVIGDIGKWATDTNNQRGVYNLVAGAVGVTRALSRAGPSLAMIAG